MTFLHAFCGGIEDAIHSYSCIPANITLIGNLFTIEEKTVSHPYNFARLGLEEFQVSTESDYYSRCPSSGYIRAIGPVPFTSNVKHSESDYISPEALIQLHPDSFKFNQVDSG